jgi:hypothetical protein
MPTGTRKLGDCDQASGRLSRNDGNLVPTLAAVCRTQRAHCHPLEFRPWFQVKFPEHFAYLQDCRRQHARLDEQVRRTLIAVLAREFVRLGGWP